MSENESDDAREKEGIWIGSCSGIFEIPKSGLADYMKAYRWFAVAGAVLLAIIVLIEL